MGGVFILCPLRQEPLLLNCSRSASLEEPEVLLEALSKRASPKSNPRCLRGVQRPLPLAPLLGKQLHLASASTGLHLQTALISVSWGDEVI